MRGSVAAYLISSATCGVITADQLQAQARAGTRISLPPPARSARLHHVRIKRVLLVHNASQPSCLARLALTTGAVDSEPCLERRLLPAS